LKRAAARESDPALSTWEEQVSQRLHAVIDDACAVLPSLRAAVADLAVDDVPYRLLAMAVHGALTGNPAPAMPVCVMSRLWWSGAEALDDVADDPSGRGWSACSFGKTLTAATACLVLLPQVVLDREVLATEIRQDWQRELTMACLQAADGQLADLSEDDGDFSWSQVIASYRKKTGAPYARDAVMAARLTTADPQTLRGWRAFGSLFGLLRQLHNDAASATSEKDEDLANGTRILRLAVALELSRPAVREILLELRRRARSDPAARAELRHRLDEPGIANRYTARIDTLRQHACALLDRLAAPSSHRDLLHRLVHTSSAGASP